MKTVKKIFFLTKEEVKKIMDESGDRFIDDSAPHFELEDGEIIYTKCGGPASTDTWWNKLGEKRWE